MHHLNLRSGFALIILVLLFSACSFTETATPVGVVESPCPSCPPPVPELTPVPTQTLEPTLTTESHTLTICLGAEPDTLFYYESSMLVARSVLEAIYDGPIDSLSYGFQPVILEKLPSLADGDARIAPVQVLAGDRVVADNGEVVLLAEGQLVRPYGCNRSDCAVIFDGAPIEMSQLSADFTLLEGLKWSDGEPLTTADAVFSFEVARQCETDLEWCTVDLPLKDTADFVALDQRTARWIGLPGNLDPHYMINFFHPLPEHQLGDMSVTEMSDADQAARLPMGWGPYQLEAWDAGEELRMNKNPHYFRADEGLPRFESLVFKLTGENSFQNISMILEGDCDLVEQDAALDDVLDLLIGMDQLELLQANVVSGYVWEHFDFSLLHADYDDGFQVNSDRPDLFGDVRTRQAIALCLDRERVINEAVYQLPEIRESYLVPGHPLYDQLFGISAAPNTYIPHEHPLYNPEIAVYKYDPQAAGQLLDEVGWIDHDNDPSTPRQAQSVPGVPDGSLFAFNYSTTEARQRQQAARILAESLSRCGIQVNIQHWNSAEFFELPTSPVLNRNFDVAEFAWLTGEIPPCDLFLTENIPGDPLLLNADGKQRFPRGWEGQNNSGYSSPEYDEACLAALAALPGQPGYIENHQLAQELFARDLPVVPLFQRIKVTAAGEGLCGYEMDPTADSDTWGIEQYGYGDECAK